MLVEVHTLVMCTFFMTYCTSSYSLYVSAQTKKPPKKPRACSALCLCIVHVTFQDGVFKGIKKLSSHPSSPPPPLDRAFTCSKLLTRTRADVASLWRHSVLDSESRRIMLHAKMHMTTFCLGNGPICIRIIAGEDVLRADIT